MSVIVIDKMLKIRRLPIDLKTFSIHIWRESLGLFRRHFFYFNVFIRFCCLNQFDLIFFHIYINFIRFKLVPLIIMTSYSCPDCFNWHRIQRARWREEPSFLHILRLNLNLFPRFNLRQLSWLPNHKILIKNILFNIRQQSLIFIKINRCS